MNPRNAILSLTAAAIVAVVSSVAAAHGPTAQTTTFDVYAADALPSAPIEGPFILDVHATIGGEGFIVGQPGRATVAVQDDALVFTIGGEALHGIERETYTVAIPLAQLPARRTEVLISAQYDGHDMRLVAYTEGMAAPIVASAPAPHAATMLQQLSVMEDLMGVGDCSSRMVIGDPATCGAEGYANGATVSRAALTVS